MPGVSGNPNGRKPRATESEIEAALEKAMPSADVLSKLADAVARREGWAIQLYLAYKWGRPVEKQEHSGPEGGAIIVRWLTDEDSPDSV